MNEKDLTVNNKNGNILTQALKAVKGENTHQLIEDFTSEMTLVAEGLFEDQNTLRKELQKLSGESDARLQKVSSSIDEVNSALAEDNRKTEEKIKELSRKLDNLEKQMHEKENKKKKEGSVIERLTTLALIISVTAILLTLMIKLL